MKGSTVRGRVVPRVDPTIYPEEEKVGEDTLQRLIMEFLRPLVQFWLNGRGIKALVGADQFIYYRQYDSTARIAPDLYVLFGIDPDTHVRVWKTWETRVFPSFCFEVASQDRDKDYFEAPQRYQQLGVPEVIVFDPYHDQEGERVRWQVYRRVKKRGLVCVEVSQADRVRSKQLGCWFRCVGEGYSTRVRIAVGPRGDELVPSEAEEERAAKEAALKRVHELEEKLRKLERRSRRS